MESRELTVIIVTFKSETRVINCLKSISKNISVIVVENSNDKKFKSRIEENFNNVNCILTGENKGYAAANNIGLKLVKTKYALVLNPDTILNSQAIQNFLNTVNKVQDFWLIGPAVNQMVDFDFKKKNLIEVNNIKGFAIFFNISKFNQNFFDENFFLYFEEIDLCKRVKNNNGKIYLDNSIIISHDGANSVHNSNIIELEKNRNWHWMWSTFYYHKKHKGFFLSLLIIFPKLLSALIKSLFYLLILNKNKRDIYLCRLSGIFNSMIGKKSWYRPALD
ncbi:glycosyltransferase [Pelagibacteraceae bacterium]|nr:glycosyltransferase [Pelagibacteraceae bacterium]|tara:strand:- start:1450 stop:2283 length:834 start_codon:yes stop_codon:yes gene_type:complete